jgi:hypothetical protein
MVSETCASGKSFDQPDDAGRQSLLAAITRSAGMRFPSNLRPPESSVNGKLNTRSMATIQGNQIFALVDIPKGSEIFSPTVAKGNHPLIYSFGTVSSNPGPNNGHGSQMRQGRQ